MAPALPEASRPASAERQKGRRPKRPKIVLPAAAVKVIQAAGTPALQMQ